MTHIKEMCIEVSDCCLEKDFQNNKTTLAAPIEENM